MSRKQLGVETMVAPFRQWRECRMKPSQAIEGTSCVARRQLAEEFVVAARFYYEAEVQLSAYSTNATSKGQFRPATTETHGKPIRAWKISGLHSKHTLNPISVVGRSAPTAQETSAAFRGSELAVEILWIFASVGASSDRHA